MKEKSIELLLSVMAYYSNYPTVFEVKNGEKMKEGKTFRIIFFPITGERYTETMFQLAENPKYNEYLLTMGVLPDNQDYNEELLHANVVKYLATNEIDYCYDLKNENWIIKFPEQIIQNNLKDYFSLFNEGYDFVNNLQQQNFINRLRKIGEEKTKRLQREYFKCSN